MGTLFARSDFVHTMHYIVHCVLLPPLIHYTIHFWSCVNTTSATQLILSRQTQGPNPKVYKEQDDNIGKMTLHMRTLQVIIILPGPPLYLGFTNSSVLLCMYSCNSDLHYFSILAKKVPSILQQSKILEVQKMARREEISCPFDLEDTYGLRCCDYNRVVLFYIRLFLEACQESPYACNFLFNKIMKGFPRVKCCLGPS